MRGPRTYNLSKAAATAGFTLIEMLVGLSLLALIMSFF